MKKKRLANKERDTVIWAYSTVATECLVPLGTSSSAASIYIIYSLYIPYTWAPQWWKLPVWDDGYMVAVSGSHNLVQTWGEDN